MVHREDTVKLLNKRKFNHIKIFEKSFQVRLSQQIKLLLWKRLCEYRKSNYEAVKVVVPTVMIFILILLIYQVVNGLFHDGALEPFVVPLAFWALIHRMVTQVMSEKSSHLQESMKMMGLMDSAYWISYFLFDGVFIGYWLSFVAALLSYSGGLFHEAPFGIVWGFLWVFCMASVPFSFLLCSFFDTPQTAGQATLGILLGFYVFYVVLFYGDMPIVLDLSLYATQVLCCFVPPLALQIGAGSFLKSYESKGGLSVGGIIGIMIADMFIYSALAWYFSRVWPSQLGTTKPFWFIFSSSYWFPDKITPSESLSADSFSSAKGQTKLQLTELHGREKNSNCTYNPIQEDAEFSELESNIGAVHKQNYVSTELANEKVLGNPTIMVHNMHKSFDTQVAVNDLSFDMYENQIFALLGHNGAGKTTLINILTGLTSPDRGSGANATVYGSSILTEMDKVRQSMGICPQQDVLFDKLTVKQHVLFFAQLKGASVEDAYDEAESLLVQFHLDTHSGHYKHQLSGGQRRKLSVAIAVCGGSKFVLLDEPTAGMDPLARRELWDLLASLRKGRTMLLTTHYMDEADVLGDRVGIMAQGQMQCCGSTQFLKRTYGDGYKLIFDKKADMTSVQQAALTQYIQIRLPEAVFETENLSEDQVVFILPFSTVNHFGAFFESLDDGSNLSDLHVNSYGLTGPSLEDVFIKVGGDHSVKPQTSSPLTGIGATTHEYEVSFTRQVAAMVGRKLKYAMNDLITIPLLLLPIGSILIAVIIYRTQTLSDLDSTNNIFAAVIYAFGYMGASGLIAEFVVRERNDKLRNVLTVMGCDFRAYWLGTFIADYLIMSIPMVIMWICWGAANMSDYYSRSGGLCFFITAFFTAQLVAFSYFFSFFFVKPKTAIALLPLITLLLVIVPIICMLVVLKIAQNTGHKFTWFAIAGYNMWGIMGFSPHGALFVSLLITVGEYGITHKPPIGVTISVMVLETAVMLAYSYFTDIHAITHPDNCSNNHNNNIDGNIGIDKSYIKALDDDVRAERRRAIAAPKDSALLIVKRLRKIFKFDRTDRDSGERRSENIVAAQDISFVVERGEVFGLLGANGAGKTTILSMLTRQLTADFGDAFINGFSIRHEFSKGATNLGVVTQSNSLWDKLSVQDHLFLFARLRGVPEKEVRYIVDGTIDQLELTPHRHKLSMRLSGGMKRKLCVAIALIGDPKVVLLDEPSAGLDPVSRHNLWSVILRTMSHRAVILTTHSMDEAEFLCKRIGIMTQGQLRALGTKQHLKTKFGSGFELVIKLHVHEFDKQLTEITDFVTSLAPSSHLISENGGLLTFEIPRAEMRMGHAFSQLESNKKNLNIEDYSIAQPTLEQVFIRTVKRYD